MSTLRLEAVFVGSIGHGIRHTIGSNVFKLSTYCHQFIFRSSILKLSFFISGDAVTGFVSKSKISYVLLLGKSKVHKIITDNYIHRRRYFLKCSWRSLLPRLIFEELPSLRQKQQPVWLPKSERHIHTMI